MFLTYVSQKYVWLKKLKDGQNSKEDLLIGKIFYTILKEQEMMRYIPMINHI